MQLDVEAVDDIEDIDEATVPTGVDAAEYVLYGGKGGVGKTTMAAATALASARNGTKTLVVSTDPAHSLSDTLETDIPADPTSIRDDIPLYAAEIDPETALSDGPFGMGGANPLAGMLGDDVADSLAGSMPGSDEAAAIRLLLEYLDDPRFDRVVVDTAPTGHTLRLLELPEMLDSMAGKIITLRERVSGLFQFGEQDEEDQFDDLEAFSEQIERLRALLRDPTRTDFRVVTTPEEMSVFEAERLLDRLDAFDIPVETIVVNRIMQDPTEVADINPDWFVAPNHTDCEFCQQRWQVQQRALQQSQEIFRGHQVRRVPLFAEEVRGEQLLAIVGACLAE